MTYLIILLVTFAIVTALTYAIHKMDDPSGDAQLGLFALTWLVGAVVCVTTISFAIFDYFFDTPLLGIPLSILVLYLGNKFITR